MSVSEILFVVAGALLGLAFQGGMFLFLIPFAVVAFSLACMNRPSLPNGTTVLPVIKRDKRSTALTPVVSPEIRNEFANNVKMETNEPNSSLRVNEIWSRANSDVDKAFGAILRCLKVLMPQANTLTIFTNGGSANASATAGSAAPRRTSRSHDAQTCGSFGRPAPPRPASATS